MSFLAIIFVFGLLVLIHEFGHFIAAKMMGVRVERFSIGFPPRLFGKKIGDTDYCISAIPLGGYVKMSGMIDESMDTETTGADYEFNSKPVWKRVVIISGGVIMNFILAVLVLTFLNYSKGKSVLPYTEIGLVGSGGTAAKIGFHPGDKILAVNGRPVETWNQIHERFLEGLNDDIVFKVQRGEQTLSLTFKKEWFNEENSEQLDMAPNLPSKVGAVSPGMPAGKAGLMRGDEIIEIAGVPVADWMDMTEEIRKYPGKEITIKYLRNGQEMVAAIKPVEVLETDSSGAQITVGKIGIGFYSVHYPVSLGEAIEEGFNGTFAMIGMNARAIWWWISGTKSAREIIGGPIMIAKMAGDAAEAGWDQLWYLIAALSAVLAFFNILPIPALDGGHLLLLIIEGIRRKPLSTRAKMTIQQVGMAVLLTFIVFVIYVDLKRLFF